MILSIKHSQKKAKSLELAVLKDKYFFDLRDRLEGPESFSSFSRTLGYLRVFQRGNFSVISRRVFIWRALNQKRLPVIKGDVPVFSVCFALRLSRAAQNQGFQSQKMTCDLSQSEKIRHKFLAMSCLLKPWSQNVVSNWSWPRMNLGWRHGNGSEFLHEALRVCPCSSLFHSVSKG